MAAVVTLAWGIFDVVFWAAEVAVSVVGHDLN